MERPETRYVDVGGAAVPHTIMGQGPPDVDRGEHELKGVPGTWKLYRALP